MSWNARVRCVNDNNGETAFMKNKVYTVINSFIRNDTGFNFGEFNNINELNRCFESQFELINCENCEHNSGKMNLEYCKKYCYLCIQESNWEPKETATDINVESIVKDNVNHPNHYNQGKYEVIDIIEDAIKDLKGIEAFCMGNVLKYALRYPYKNNGIEDVKKAAWYMERLIEGGNKY